MQFTPSHVDSLRASLAALREHGVSSAEFAANGALIKVEFFAQLPPIEELAKDASPQSEILSEVEKAQLRLATGAHRMRESNGE